jgi:hypothetical protein
MAATLGRRSECRVHAGAGRPAPQREGELPPPLASSTESSSAEPSGRTWTPCHLEVHYEMAIPYRLMAMIIGTVTTDDTVERSSADADSASMVLYVAASRTTMVARRSLPDLVGSEEDERAPFLFQGIR